MQRRAALLGLATLLLGPATARAQAGMPQPPPAAAPRDRGARRPTVEMSFDELPPARRRLIQQRLAGEGNPPLSADEARRQWDGMTQLQRRLATRRQDGDQGADRQARRMRRQEAAEGEPATPRRRQAPMAEPPPGAAPPQMQ
jgi:hypothetical protein